MNEASLLALKKCISALAKLDLIDQGNIVCVLEKIIRKRNDLDETLRQKEANLNVYEVKARFLEEEINNLSKVGESS